MAKKASRPRRNFPSYRGRFLVRESRGNAVASKWPRKRPSPRHPVSEWWTEWFRQALLAYRALPGEFKRELLKAGRGQPQFPRDLAVASMRGTLWSYRSSEGMVRYPMAAYSKVSASLDTIAQLPGSILYRGKLLWEYVTAPSGDNYVLAWNDAAKVPLWAQLVSGAGYSPPDPDDFPTLVSATTMALEQSPTGPLVLVREPNNATANCGLALRALRPPPAAYTFGLRVAAQHGNGRGAVIVVRDSSSGKFLSFSWLYTTSSSVPALVIERWNSENGTALGVTSRAFLATAPLFLRIEDDGTDFHFLVSADAAGWCELGTHPRTSFTAAPDQIGFGLRTAFVENIPSSVSVIHFLEE